MGSYAVVGFAPGEPRLSSSLLDTRIGQEESDAVREVISTPAAPSSAMYSQAVKAGAHLYVSGLVGSTASTGALAGSTIQEQTSQALQNCRAVLEAAGGTIDDVVEVGVLLTHPEDFAGMNEEYAKWFPSAPPTRYVAKLGVDLPGVLISIRMTAYLG